MSIAGRAQGIVEQRMAAYGPPSENHACTAAMWGAYLERRRQACDRLGVPFVLDAEDVCWLNVLQKISRHANERQDDNRVDAIGFAINADMIGGAA